MKLRKPKRNDLIFLVVIVLFIIPQTRQPIQVLLHKGLALFAPSVKNEADRTRIAFKDWKLQDSQGNKINFKDLEGKVIFLNFWATWCPPCIAEMGSIDKLYKDYKDKLVFILVSNEKPKIVQRFLNKKNYNLDSYAPLSAYPDDFNIQSIPRTFLINKEGDIIIDKSGAANWNSETIRTLIDELIME